MRLTPAGPLRVRMGDPASVECRAAGRPRPKMTWKRQGSTLQLVTKEANDANVIQVKTRKYTGQGRRAPFGASAGVTAALFSQWPVVHPEDAGVYICQAENSEGMTEIKVELFVEGGPGAPVASVSATEMTVVEGHTVTMACRASGKTVP